MHLDRHCAAWARRALAFTPRALALTMGALCASCFIDSGDCVSQGIRIEPCAIPMKVGQTRVFSATVTADPNDDVNWVQSDALDAGFDLTVGDGEIELVGTLGAGAVYKLRAESASDPARFGESIITVLGNNYGYPPPPVQINGTDEPVGYQSAVAAGGNRYYVAYADPNGVPRGPVNNFFVKQFDLATNTERTAIGGQFTLFGSGDPSAPAPNIAADCQGNGYWLDRVDSSAPTVLRRLSAAGVLSQFEFTDHLPSGMLAIACDGTIYFAGSEFSTESNGIFRISQFGSAPVEFPLTGFSNAADVFETMVIDSDGRILLADADPEFCGQFGNGVPQILRVVPTNGVGVPDPGFVPRSQPIPTEVVPFTDGVQALAVDGAGVVYVIPIGESDCVRQPSTVVVYLNSAGLEVDSRRDYVYQCPDLCNVDCGAKLDFQNLRSIAVSALGKLRVIDDVDLCDVKDPNCLPPECLVTVRLILLDP